MSLRTSRESATLDSYRVAREREAALLRAHDHRRALRFALIVAALVATVIAGAAFYVTRGAA